jgi:hypothetical protein
MYNEIEITMRLLALKDRLSPAQMKTVAPVTGKELGRG